MNENLPKVLIIDGYNLIGAAPEAFTKMPALENRREHLIRMLQSTPHLRNSKIIIVFDGDSSKGKPKKYQFHNIEVIFSGDQQNADQVIQEIIRQNSSSKSLHIISSDREIQNSARDHHAHLSSSQEFWKQLRKNHSNKAIPKESKTVNKQELSQREVQEWLTIFKKGKPDDDEN
jgi:predicted RNA-binding protein with PIN domain